MGAEAHQSHPAPRLLQNQCLALLQIRQPEVRDRCAPNNGYFHPGCMRRGPTPHTRWRTSWLAVFSPEVVVDIDGVNDDCYRQTGYQLFNSDGFGVVGSCLRAQTPVRLASQSALKTGTETLQTTVIGRTGDRVCRARTDHHVTSLLTLAGCLTRTQPRSP